MTKKVEEKKRVDKVNYYLDIAEAVIERGTCLRRNYGAIIVKNDEIMPCPSMVDIILRSQKDKKKYYMILLICEI